MATDEVGYASHVLEDALAFELSKHLAGTEGDVSIPTLISWVREGRCPDEQWRGTMREVLWQLSAPAFAGLLWHPKLTPKQVGDFVRYTEAHVRVFPYLPLPNPAMVNLLRLCLPDEMWPETPDDTDLLYRSMNLEEGPQAW